MAGRGRPKGQGDAERETMSAIRLGQVEDALLSGRSHSWCMEHFSQSPELGGWGVRPRQVQNYILRVEQQWKERAPTATPELRAQARERVLMLMRTCLENSEAPGAFAGATKAADMLNKIDGVYAPEKVEHSGSVDVAAMSPAQRRARLAELMAKAASARADGG